jgi:type IV pilus assembly protein PilE
MCAYKKARLEAFTLQELLIVLVIIGILVLVSLPVLMPLISRTRSVEAKQALTHLYQLQKTHFYEYSRYSENLEQIGFEQERLVTDEDNPGGANYLVEIVDATPTSFLARATAIVDFDGDGEYNIWEIDQNKHLTEVVKD